MRFVDANVFIEAVFTPREATPKLLEQRVQATEIIGRIHDGEETATSVVHLSEVTNVLKSKKSRLAASEALKLSIEWVLGCFREPNLKVLTVAEDQYHRAAMLAAERLVGVNDALAVLLCREVLRTNEVYTFDKKDFQRIDPALRLLP